MGRMLQHKANLSPLEKAEAMADDLLKLSAGAHRYHVGLLGLDMANDMSNWMKLAADAAQEIYSELKVLINKNDNTVEAYVQINHNASQIFEKYNQYSGLAKTMLERSKNQQVCACLISQCFQKL